MNGPCPAPWLPCSSPAANSKCLTPESGLYSVHDNASQISEVFKGGIHSHYPNTSPLILVTLWTLPLHHLDLSLPFGFLNDSRNSCIILLIQQLGLQLKKICKYCKAQVHSKGRQSHQAHWKASANHKFFQYRDNHDTEPVRTTLWRWGVLPQQLQE